MTDLIHKFKIGQIVDLIPTTFRSAAKGSYEIMRLVPVSMQDPQYRIKSKSQNVERIVTEEQLSRTE